jgi:Family of unknown function (DUF6065)
MTFHCQENLLGVIAPPVRATEFIPEWYRKLPTHVPVDSIEDHRQTVKRCMPFVDAMTTGFILTTLADIRFKLSDDGSTINDSTDFPVNLIAAHGIRQIEGSTHEKDKSIPLKFANQWVVKTPPGWSTLFTPLLNRENRYFDVLSGLVDTDIYSLPVNIPFFFKPSCFGTSFTMEKGTPICQMIPVKRESFTMETRANTKAELKTMEHQHLSIKSATGFYRKFVRAKR